MFSAKYPSLSACLLRSEKWFTRFGRATETPDGAIIHVDRGASVLAVAHLDTVLFAAPQWRGSTVICPQLDDRLGAWAILSVLPSLGADCDVLLTTGEESGRSTARHFVSPRQYNWVFSLDRRGDDCVMYDYESRKKRRLLKDHGWTVGHGSFSDICALEHLGCMGVNFGVGYHAEHTYGCHADLRDTIRQCNRVASFWRAEHDRAHPWKPQDRESKIWWHTLPWAGSRLDRRASRSTERRLWQCDGCSYMVEHVTRINGMSLCADCIRWYTRPCAECGRMIVDVGAGQALCDQCSTFSAWAKDCF